MAICVNVLAEGGVGDFRLRHRIPSGNSNAQFTPHFATTRIVTLTHVHTELCRLFCLRHNFAWYIEILYFSFRRTLTNPQANIRFADESLQVETTIQVFEWPNYTASTIKALSYPKRFNCITG